MASVPASERNFALSNDEKLQWARDIQRSRRELDEASGRHRALIKRAKSEGVAVKALLDAIKARRMEPDEVVSQERDRLHYMQLLGIPGIGPDTIFVFDTEITEKTQQEEDLWEADDRGYRAGRNGTPMDDCPFDAGTEAYDAWARAWRKGQASIAVEMGPNAKIASATRKHPGRAETASPQHGEDTSATDAAASEAPTPRPARRGAGKSNGSTRGRRGRGAVEAGAVH